MIALHTVYVVTLVSQATSALVLSFLAWSDRRSRGLVPLAAACALHVLAIFFMPMWRNSNRWWPEAISAAELPFIFFLTYCGMHAFVRQGERISRYLLPPVAAVMVLVFALAPWTRLWSMQIARVAGIVMIGFTLPMLWQPRSSALCRTSRATAALLFLVLVTFLVRLPLEPHVPASNFLISLRELTIIEITVLAFSFLAVYLADSKRRLNVETRVDALTGLLNRRAMEEHAATQVHAAQRSGKPLALLMMDLDAFKLLNDTWGHGVGDRALRAVGDVLRSHARERSHTVARLGGEEFAVLLPDHTIDNAHLLAERLRTFISGATVFEGNRPVSFTTSIGVSAWHAGEDTWANMLQRADAALYRAKREGRNRVALCEHALKVNHSAGRSVRAYRDSGSAAMHHGNPSSSAEDPTEAEAIGAGPMHSR